MQVKPLSDLRIVGAAGQEVPYHGYIELHLRFPQASAGEEIEGTTVALVCPDSQQGKDVPLLVGTNTSIVRGLLHKCKMEGGRQFLKTHHIDSAWAAVLNVALSSDSGVLGVVKSSRKSQTLIMPGQEAHISGYFRNRKREEGEVLIEAASSAELPEGLSVKETITN